jgi:hypothetical protein
MPSMKRFYSYFFIVFFLLLFLGSKPLMAQPNPLCDPDDPYCPIDSGLVVLLIIGAGYGVIKYIVLNKQTKDSGNQLAEK